MRINTLRLRDFRGFSEAEFQPGSRFNLLLGANGSGKTTILEAAHLLAHGRSFRARVRDGLVRHGAPALQAYAEWLDASGAAHRAGLEHTGSMWKGRLDSEDVRQITRFCEALAVVSFEPGSHALVDGPAEGRRRYLDWGMFHVEQRFLPEWRRYARALKQRNALLRQRGVGAQLDAWEQELSASGEVIAQLRDQHVTALQPHFARSVSLLLPAAGASDLTISPGWRRQELELADALLLGRERDSAAGYTGVGPHRAELRVVMEGFHSRAALSRGQAKQLALSMLLAQAALIAEADGWPVVQLDDLASELDADHQHRVLDALEQTPAQVIVTGTRAPEGWDSLNAPAALFHVEQRAITRA